MKIRSLKRLMLDILAQANYMVVRSDELVREREEAHATAHELQLLLDEPRCDPVNLGVGTCGGTPPDDSSGPIAARCVEDVPKIEVRPLTRIAHDEFSEPASIDRKWVKDIAASNLFKSLVTEFANYPRHSYVPDVERAFLYCLVLQMKPEVVAEIGSSYCGTSEVISRALWENGRGLLHTTDPFGGERCPRIIEQWPKSLQKVVRFYDKSSMDFFATIAQAGVRLDIAFVDGNHDFEFAQFDIRMAARLLRPGGILIVDNSEQTGPFYAAAEFVRQNPDWIELGSAIAERNIDGPFETDRTTVPEGRFLALRAPQSYSIGTIPRTVGQVRSRARVRGFSCRIVGDALPGVLHYQLVLRAFRNRDSEIEEYRSVGRIPLEHTSAGGEIIHVFANPLVSVLHDVHGDCTHTVEIELAWQGYHGDPFIYLAGAPSPVDDGVESPEFALDQRTLRKSGPTKT